MLQCAFILTSWPGISFKTQALYATVFITRYLDLFYEWVSLYNFTMKVFFIASSCYILYLMKVKYRCARPPRATKLPPNGAPPGQHTTPR